MWVVRTEYGEPRPRPDLVCYCHAWDSTIECKIVCNCKRITGCVDDNWHLHHRDQTSLAGAKVAGLYSCIARRPRSDDVLVGRRCIAIKGKTMRMHHAKLMVSPNNDWDNFQCERTNSHQHNHHHYNARSPEGEWCYTVEHIVPEHQVVREWSWPLD